MKDKIELVIFDCDGVVIDSEVLSAHVLIELLHQQQIDIDSDYVQQHFLGCSFNTVSEKITQAFKRTLPDRFEENYREALLAKFASALQPTPGIDTVLQQLAVAKCIATSSSPARTAKALDVVNFSRYFSNSVFTSSEVKHGKPAPDLFLHAAKQMGVLPERCLVIEDSTAGISAALRAGMQVLHYSGGQHLQHSINPVTKHYPEIINLSSWQQFYTVFPTLKQVEQ